MYDLVWKDATLWTKYPGSEKIPSPPQDMAVRKAALLLWMEHCVACAPTECYSSCSLYVPRRDHKCARFVYGIFPNKQVTGLFRYGGNYGIVGFASVEVSGSAPVIRDLVLSCRVAQEKVEEIFL